MHLDDNNIKYKYILNTFDIKVSSCENILRVYIDDKLSFNDYFYVCVKDAKNFSKKLLTNVYNTVLTNVCKIYARPYL